MQTPTPCAFPCPVTKMVLSAAATGLQPGDVIIEIDRQPVRKVDDYRRLLAALGEGEDVLLLVNRAGNQQFAVVKRSPDSPP